MLVLLCLLPLVQGVIVSLSLKNYLFEPPFQIDFVDPLTGKSTKIANLSTDARPLCAALRNDNTIVYGAVFSTKESCLINVDLSTGKIQEGQRYPSYFFTNLAFDTVTNQTFVTSSGTSNSLFELLRNQTLRKIVDFPEFFYSDISTYSSSKHVFFLLAGSGTPSVSKLLAVGTVGAQEGKTLYNVPVALGVNSLAFDDTLGVLYAWGYDDTYRAILVSLDFTTGKILKTFFESSTLFASPAVCINKEGTTIYSSMYDKPHNASVFLTLELSESKATLVPAERYAMTMSLQ